ncbi:MAG TPA: tetratricopeptide repeat protein [Steroidobacteraceae bacterium]|nr:tetratricopeptide repeat protein [Steroidobacteraceae bacterium]
MHNQRRRRTLAALVGLGVWTAGCTGFAPRSEPGVRMLMAEVAIERGEYAFAAREYRLAAAASKDREISERAARVAFDHGLDRDLERTAREWLAREPKSEVARRFEAVALLQLDRRAEAAQQFGVLVDTAYPAPADAFMALNESLSEVRNDTGAARTVGLLAARYPAVAEAGYAHASLALAAGDSPTALDAVARALALRPGWREARWLEARARIASGDCARGVAEAGALAAESTDPDRLVYAWLLAACERSAEARPFFEDLARGRVSRAEALEGLASLDVEAQRWDEATSRYTEMLATGRNTDRAFFGLAVVAERKGDAAQAVRLYSRVTAGPRAVAAQLRAYRLLLDQGEAATAARQLDDFVATAIEDRVAVTSGRAQILADVGRGADALALLDRAIAAYPDREELRYARATVLERTGAVERALAELGDLARARPADPTAQNALGFTLADHGLRLPEAEERIRAALAERPDSAAIRDSLGWVLHRRGQSAAGLEWLKRAYAADPDGEIAAHIGEAQWALGDQTGAQKTWREALERSPGDPHLKDSLARHGGSGP